MPADYAGFIYEYASPGPLSCIGGFSSLAGASAFFSSGLEMKNTSALDKPWANASSWEP